MAGNEIRLDVPSRVHGVGIAVARFNHFVTEQLLQGALDALQRHGVAEEEVTVAWVPGAFELPLAAELLLDSGCNGIVALGAVIRGETPHFDYVAGECARGLQDVALRRTRPVAFGVLTTETVEQALERAGASEGNKGFDAAMSLLNMLNLAGSLSGLPGDDG